MGEKLKVLWYSDSPTTATGFATVARNLLNVLYKTGKYDFTIVGINHSGAPYDRVKFPYDIYPAANALTHDERYKDVYGRQLLVDMARTGHFDLVFMIQDTFIVQTFIDALIKVREGLPLEKKFAMIHYFPIDGTPKKSWVTDVVAKMDVPVAYTNYAKNECLKIMDTLKDMDVIYHGVDKDIFFPPSDTSFRDKFFSSHKDKFIVLNVNRNQPRKDLWRTFAGFKLFHEKHPDSFLFMLCQMDDVGGNLVEIAEHYGLKWDVDWACPAPGSYGANQGYPIEIVNQIYGACDVVTSTTVGEGFGLSFNEGAACKKTLLFPRNTALVEMVGENEERGYFLSSGENPNQFTFMGPGDNNILRPTVNVYSLADQLAYIYENPEEATAKAERAYNEIWTWKQVGEQWKAVFLKAEEKLRIMRIEMKADRNAPCPCLSGKKFKHCHGK